MTSIDVVIPNYNYGHYLEGCVQSVLDQGIDELRILIIDNASDDDSCQIARRLAGKDERISLRLRPRNLGAHASFNEGIDWARGDALLILCADDMIAPGALMRASAILDERPSVNLVFGRAEFRTTGDTGARPAITSAGGWRVESGESFIHRLCQQGHNTVSGPTVLVRTSAQKRVGLYNPSLSHTDDLEMWLRIATTGNVASTEAIQAVARVHANNRSASVGTTHRWNMEFEAAYRAFFSGLGAGMPGSDRLLKTAMRSIADRSYWCGIRALWQREAGAGELLRHAIRLHPACAILPSFGHLASEKRLRKALSIVLGQPGIRKGG
ncbi:glycosyltransferase family 2 protein [Rhizobium sp. Root482]|uniref:glycosyltransferase family 2 protein n=1 Tax=Rhizobium sp. Root482 TaxID=1736543 RepID=UPI0009E747F6|nr:glycosyltransferase family A protein [Rhizobium sp. Root482]